MTASAQLLQRQKAAVAGGIATRAIFAQSAKNAELWDVDGKRYIDLAAGIAVNNTGHRHPKVMQAVLAQTERFTHTCFNVAPFEDYIRLAERLNALVPTGAENRTMLVTTGAEAVENAVKIARAATKRPGVIAFSGAFHGRTMLGMALTGKVQPYKKSFGPFPSDIFHAAFPNAYTGPSVEEAIASLERLFASDIDPERVAAFLIEPVQGEGGFNVASRDFLVKLREIADRHRILLIVDEIQTGMARTGRMLAIEHSGVRPDLVTMAKGLAGGFPLSAVTGRAELVDTVHAGGLGGTFAGNPLAVAAANAVLDVLEEEQLCARATVIGDKITERLRTIAARQGNERIGDVRGLGAMVAFELVEDRASKAAAPQLTNAVIAEAEKRGVIVLPCGTRANVVRLLPPLTIEDDTLTEALDLLEAAIEAALSQP
ncbi:4-aminobutyrate aminotransferase [Pseudolabrys sp. Root1462]|uniref:4-aminobutyrate--2-oxoglutarate transaminase n=1 Tax=Pseudolabrys sp. Root1462 TaxID=1736466 RepID=UPI0007036EAE|nr:4-aminobutyrate--2-oxoglutarate transaminase [Pseudolabrys sp. Root1462]KQZ00462.1 4-aminobutyrate aminotransferase [Pseudolabrys sp. Root1462]